MGIESDAFDPLDEFFGELQSAAYESQSLEYAHRMENAPYDPGVMIIVMRYDCPYSCDHCFFSSNPSSHTILPEQNVMEAIDFARDIGVQAVMPTGGEAMLDPESVFRALSQVRDNGMGLFLQSAFLGETEEEINYNADRLQELGLNTFLTSLSMYHEDAQPAFMTMGYINYLLMMIDALTKRGIKVDIKNTWDAQSGKESTDFANEFANRLLGNGIDYLGERFEDGFKVFIVNGVQVGLTDPSIISVGKARASSLTSQKPYQWQDSLYHCPIFHEPHHDGGMVTLYPDGNVARCCAAERGANFGFGNVFTHPWPDILENIRQSPYVRFDMDGTLQEAHEMLQNEFPQFLPSNGAGQACEICSPVVANKRLRDRLAKRLHQPKLFTPVSDQ